MIFILLLLTCCSATVSAHHEQYRWRDTSAAPLTAPMVVGARGLDPAHPTEIGLNDVLIVSVANLDVFMKSAVSMENVILVMDNQRFDGIKADNIDLNTNEITFRLSLDDFSGMNQKQWAEVLGKPNPWTTRAVSVSIAQASGGSPISTAVSKVDRVTDQNVIVPASLKDGFSMQIRIIHTNRFYAASVVVLAFVIFFTIKARSTTMLRAASPEDGTNSEGAYSLSLTQMAFWFMLVVISSIYLYTITSLYVPISMSVLGIITISTTSTLAASGIDLTKRKNAVRTGSTVPIRQTRSMWKDITNDGSGGLSLQRIQVVVWTILFGFYYCYRVWATVSIPDIDSSMLILMGLTSAAYVGGKIPEKT